MGVSHLFEYRTHYNHLGTPCHCPWGKRDPERHGAVKEASKLDWLKKRPDMQTEEGQAFLRHIQGLNDPVDPRYSDFSKADKLLPWITREWKKGRLVMPSKDDLYDSGFKYKDANGVERLLTKDSALEIQSALEGLKKHRKGIDVMQHKVHELVPKVQEFQDWKKSREREGLGEVLHRFDDGWTIRRLQNAAEHKDEGDMMGHCVGDPGMGYSKQTEEGSRIFASLRDPKNIPHATLDLTPDHWVNPNTGETTQNHWGTPFDEGWTPQVGPNSEVGQFYGKEDSPPLPEYEDRVNQWLNPYGVHAYGGPGEAETLTMPAADDVPSYLGIHSDNGSFLDYAPDADEEGRPAGENTEYESQDPDFKNVAANLLDGRHQYQGVGKEPKVVQWEPRVLQDVFQTARQQYHVPDFDQALAYNYNPENPDHRAVIDQWEQFKAPYYHPYTGELAQGWSGRPIDEFQNRLFNETPDRQRQPKEVIPQWMYDTENLQGGVTDLGAQQGPLAPPYIPWTKNPNLSSQTRPMYYRWVYSPTKGVTLGSNGDDHPALVPYHQGLGGVVDGQDLMHGYAYRIGNGWRLTDYEHKAVEDPFVVNQVVSALNDKESPLRASEGSWKPVKVVNWDRLHFGIPQPTIAN